MLTHSHGYIGATLMAGVAIVTATSAAMAVATS